MMLSGIFIAAGARSIRNPDVLAPQAKQVTDRIAPLLRRVHPRIPTDPERLVQLNGVVHLAGGLLLATGRLNRPAAVALAGSLVPTTLAGHPFWTNDDPAERLNNQIHVMKNLGLIGGLLLAALDTEGRPGLRWRASHRIGHGRRTVRRAVRTARRDARIALRSASTARRLPG